MRMSALLLLMVAGGLLLAGAAFAQTAVAVRPFTGIGPYSQLGKGLTNMLISDLFPLLEECGVKIVEWEHRADVIKEIELSQNPAFDPAHRLRKGLMIEPTVFADGVVTTTDTTVSWTIDLRDAETGRRIGGHKGSVPADEWLESEKKIAQSLARQLCRQGLDFSSPPVASQQPPPTDASAPAPAPASKGPDVHKQVDDVVNTLRNLKGLFGR
jgi:hypothetical protein